VGGPESDREGCCLADSLRFFYRYRSRRGRVYLANAFSLSMIPLGANEAAEICVRRINEFDLTAQVEMALEEGRLDCAVGHESTVRILWGLTGVGPKALNCQRKMIQLRPGDTLLVVQLSFRPPEGKVYTYEELKQLMEQGRIAFYAAHYGPC